MTLDDLQTFSRNKADEENGGGFISNPELIRYINQGYKFIYGKIAQRWEDFFVQEGTVGNTGLFSTVASTMGYALPSGLKKLIRVETRDAASTDDNAWKRVRRININSETVGGTPIDSVYRDAFTQFAYFLAGNKIYFKPVPATAYSIRLWYVPSATDLALAADVPVIPDEFHASIAEYAAIQCLSKSGEGIMSERMTVWNQELQNLIENIEIRNAEPEQMVITERDDQDWLRQYGF